MQVFSGVGEAITRTSSGRDLMKQLGQPAPRLLCSLVHKFGPRDTKRSDEQFDQFIKDVESGPSRAVGEVFVFVDNINGAAPVQNRLAVEVAHA